MKAPTSSKESFPARLGFRMPAEWEPHEATWIAWPHNRSDWPEKFQAIPWVYAEIVRQLSQVERVEILAEDVVQKERARKALLLSEARMNNVRFHRWRTNRVWTRDYGPTFVAGKSRLGSVKWRFNAWGKYPDWKLDDEAGRKMARFAGAKEWTPSMPTGGKPIPVVLEGGAIDVNGKGTLLATEECLLSDVQKRNPGLEREDIERVLEKYLGARKVIWLGHGIAGDDTHGHVDDITRFVAADTVVTAVESNRTDPNHKPLQENVKRLRAATDQDGKKLRVVELPMPSPVIFCGQRLPASYANFYIANGLVLVPTFNDPKDQEALAILKDCFPDRNVIGIHCRDMVWGLGTLHCMTQQQPKAK